ncbi:MAG TPA: 4Fe-4S binding protein [Gallionellaceae bacterium]|nr:4Fe-4S binding protein [Gallionellaceae bacterium]
MHVTQYHWKRRVAQFATLFLIALVPAVGLFRIDLTSASFSILGQQLWWSNFTFVAGLALVAATAPILTYMTIGTVWCGWACPQNLLSEWANNMTHKLLGKRASVDVNGKMVVAASKNKVINWLLLGLLFLGAAMVLAVIPFMFFFSVGEVWSIFTTGAQFSTFMQRLYYFIVFLIFIDIAVVRYFWCDYACMYRIGQKIFKTRDALHVAYDQTRSADCAKCNYCATSCITSIQPTDIKSYDSCIDCGECVDACNRLHEKSGTAGLLRFELGEHGAAATLGGKIRDVLARVNWLVAAMFLAGCVLTVWGIVTQPKPVPELSPAAQQHEQQLASLCATQCIAQIDTCKKGNLSACALAQACQCQCSLDHDPASTRVGEWQQCVKTNTANAKSLPHTLRK